jgi:ribose transport system ATP-binding protein
MGPGLRRDDTFMTLFQMQGVSKRYGGVRALHDADLAIEAGRIHAVLGENGAGKSTLIKIMAGVVAPDEGRMLLDGEPVSFATPAAGQCGRHRLHLPGAVADPRLVGGRQHRDQQSAAPLRLIDRPAQRRMAEEALERAGAGDIHPLALVKELPLSRRQMVEIAKALARKPRILILDEATSALTAADVTKIYAVLKRLRAEGLALVYISHRMHEIAELADACTVFCNGKSVASFAAGTKTDNEIVELMIGREYNAVFPPRSARTGLDAGDGERARRVGPAARSAPPRLVRPAERRLAEVACRRGDRPRRARRPGPARAAACPLRRAARHDGRGARSTASPSPSAVRMPRRRSRSAWR